MKYLCLVYRTAKETDALSASASDALTAESVEYVDELRERGHFLVANALEPEAAATTLRVRNGRVTLADGPVAETGEHLAGVILIEVRDLNDAIHVASRLPSARVGSVEIRPVRETHRP